MSTTVVENEKSEVKEPNTENKNEGDKLINAIGDFGKWQIMLLLVIAAPIKISSAWQQLGIVFIAPPTTFICRETNLTDNIQENTCYRDCVKYDYYTDFVNSIISQWDLICDRAWLSSFTQTLCMFGVLIGSIIFGYVADRYGRRMALLIACMLQVVTTLVQPFCPTYWLFSAVRFLIGVSTAGTMLCSFILMMEVIGPMKRELMNCLIALPLPLGQLLMPAFSYYLRSYDMFCLGVAVPNLLYLVYFFMMPESPKWLISAGRLDDASKVMTQAARWNKKPSQNMLDVAKSIANENVNKKNPEEEKQKVTYMFLMKTKTLRINTLCCCALWFILGISFYGSNQYTGQTSSNVFISVTLAAAFQFPGIIASSLLCKYYGRKITLITLLGICGVCNAFLAVPDDWFALRVTMGAIGIGCASGSFAAMYMYTTELFPTKARNMAMGASSTVSRIGSMIAPYVAALAGLAAWLPPAAFAVVPAVGAVVCFFLPETRGKTLSDHIA